MQIIILWFITSSLLLSAPLLTIDKKQHTFDDFPVQRYEDRTSSLDIEQIQKVLDFSEASNFISEGYTSSTFWYRVEIYNATNRPVETIVDAGKLVYEVDLYILSSDKTVLYRGGNGLRFQDRIIQSTTTRFPLHLNAKERKTLYFRMRHITTLFTALTITDERALVKSDLQKSQLLGLAYGGILILVLYNFFLFTSIREKVYLYYVLYIGASVTWFMMSEGYFPFTTLWGDAFYTLAANTTALFLIFIMLFSRALLLTKRYMPVLDRVLYVSIWTMSLSLLLNFYDPVLIIYIVNTVGLIIISLLFWMALKSYRLGNKIAFFYIQAQLVYFIMLLPYLLMTIDLFPYSKLVNYAPLVGSVYEAVLFSLALAYRVKMLKDEKINIEIQAQIRLEHAIQEQTKELDELNHHLEKKVAQEVEKNRDQELAMLHQNRLAQMGEMISMIAHQWRQPLNNLAMLNQTVILNYQEKRLNTKTIDYFKENTNRQIQQMSHTIEDFRDFFKPRAESVEYCVNDVIIQTIDMLAPIYRELGLVIEYTDEQKVYSQGAPSKLGQALINIINNAKDVLLERDVVNKRLRLNLKRQEDIAILTIGDNGGGVPLDIMDKIFDPYFSTKDKKNGTGLGLYMTKIIVEKHLNGNIIVENRDGGAQFKIAIAEVSRSI